MAAPEEQVEAAFWADPEDCIICGGDDYGPGYGPRTLVTCDCCLAKGTHVECWHHDTGELLGEEQLASPSFQWFCSEVRPVAGGERVAGRWPCIAARCPFKRCLCRRSAATLISACPPRPARHLLLLP